MRSALPTPPEDGRGLFDRMLRIVGMLALAVFTLAGGTLVAGKAGLLAGSRPTDLGIHEGKLKLPPDSPNCVSSQAAGGYPQIEPLGYRGDPHAAFDVLAKLVGSQPRARVVTRTPDYVHAEFSSAVLNFVDDVEFALDEAEGVIHVRSASRLGFSDMGANGERVELLRSALANALPPDLPEDSGQPER